MRNSRLARRLLRAPGSAGGTRRGRRGDGAGGTAPGGQTGRFLVFVDKICAFTFHLSSVDR